MVEIRYGEHYDIADLGGETVAHAREQFSKEFEIPAKAEARINGKGISRRQESKIKLYCDDRLTFGQKSRKGLLLVGAILMALAASGGAFAFTATTDTVDLTVTSNNEYASVAAATSGTPGWEAFRNFKGSTGSGDLFVITPDASYNGDFSVICNIANGDTLTDVYRVLVLKIKIMDSNPTTPKIVGEESYLTLSNGECSFDVNQVGFVAPYNVELVSGFWVSNKNYTAGSQSPTILCDIVQKGS